MNRHNQAIRSITTVLFGAGMFLMIFGSILLLFGEADFTQAQALEDADYIGVRECSSCHRDLTRLHSDSGHATTLRDAQRNKEAVLADFTQSEDLRQVQFPGEEVPRAFEAEDVALVVGSGKIVQRYLYEVERNDYQIFPAEWNVVEQKWQPFKMAESWPDPAYDWVQNCAGCHTTGLNPERGRWEDDGVQCEACHGPGSLHNEAVDDAGRDPTEEEMITIRQTIVLSPDAQICGQCHSRGTEPQKGLPYPIAYRPGGVLLDESVFRLASGDDPVHWWTSGHGKAQNMQFNEWVISRHAVSLASVELSEVVDESCLTCHSGDTAWNKYQQGLYEGVALETVTLENARFGVTCATCHHMHQDTPTQSLLVKEAAEICLDCHRDGFEPDSPHNPTVEMFTGITLIENVPGTPSSHEDAGADCVTCHMPDTLQIGETWTSASHTMKPALPGDTEAGQYDSCTSCHSDLSDQYLGNFIDQVQQKIQDRLSAAESALESQSTAPVWISTALGIVRHDGSLGLHNYRYATDLLDAVEAELRITAASVPSIIPVLQIEDPVECAECHETAYQHWQNSPHANASLSLTFQELFASSGRPSYCMSCHASGYDPRTETYVFEGVTCSNCHYTTSGTEHPPGPVEVATDSAVCGRCHTGEHAPTFNEWLVSDHSAAAVDCADCHTAHDNGLILEDVNTTCGSCHQEALVDEIHMGKEMTCVDCHMKVITAENGIQIIQTGHTMSIDPGTCADCHGNTHLLSVDASNLSDEERNIVLELEGEVTQLKDTASQNLQSGVIGGAIGALVLVSILFLTIRLGRAR